MKILAVADFFYPDTIGGSAIMAYEIMREMVSRGHEVTVVARSKQGLATRDSIEGMDIVRYEMPARQILYPLGVARAEGIIKSLLSEKEYHVINMHHAAAGIAAERARRDKYSAASVFVFQGPWYKEAMAKEGQLEAATQGDTSMLHPKYRARKWVDRYILDHCTAYVTLSDHMRQEALEIASTSAQKHRKIPGGVDLDRFGPAEDKMAVRRELSLPEDKIILFTARRLAARMGLENLIQAMAIVEREREDVMLLIGGQGEIKEKLQQLIRDLGLQRTTLTGYIAYDSELPKYYQASDLFVMPSITLEGFGLSTVEALACGVPVVGTSTGGTPEILNGVLPDFVLPSTEPRAIAEGILGLLDSVRDEGLKTKVRDYAERHSWKNIANSFEALFEEVAAAKGDGHE